MCILFARLHGPWRAGSVPTLSRPRVDDHDDDGPAIELF